MPETFTKNPEINSFPDHIDEQLSLPNAEDLSDAFTELSIDERIDATNEIFAGRIVLATTFGPTAPVLLKHTTDVLPDIKVVNIQHGHETEETIESIDFYKNHLSLNLDFYQGPHLPLPSTDDELERFQQQAKIEPFQQMIDEQKPLAYLSGVMYWQTEHRASMSFVEERGDIIAVNPVLDLSESDVNRFFEETGLPKNTNYFDPAKGKNQSQECQLNLTKFGQNNAK